MQFARNDADFENDTLEAFWEGSVKFERGEAEGVRSELHSGTRYSNPFLSLCSSQRTSCICAGSSRFGMCLSME